MNLMSLLLGVRQSGKMDTYPYVAVIQETKNTPEEVTDSAGGRKISPEKRKTS